ncbi:E3 ubiquitin-protein ligase bre1, partial [Chytridiales sp. JEL 0842]
DSLQQNLDLRSTKDEAQLLQNQEIRVIANTRKDRITCLESQIERLKMKLVSNSVDEFLAELYSSSPDKDVYSVLKARLRLADEKVEELTKELSAFKDASSETRDKQQLLVSIQKLEAELQTMRSRASQIETITDLERKLKDAEVKIDFCQKTEARLVSEIETIGKAWAELEEQSLRKVLNLTEKEDQILRLLAEKTKYDQKCAMLTKQSNTTSNLSIALKRQSDKQLEQIRKLEEREKTLIAQL